jgi:hypothetical protein
MEVILVKTCRIVTCQSYSAWSIAKGRSPMDPRPELCQHTHLAYDSIVRVKVA